MDVPFSHHRMPLQLRHAIWIGRPGLAFSYQCIRALSFALQLIFHKRYRPICITARSKFRLEMQKVDIRKRAEFPSFKPLRCMKIIAKLRFRILTARRSCWLTIRGQLIRSSPSDRYCADQAWLARWCCVRNRVICMIDKL